MAEALLAEAETEKTPIKTIFPIKALLWERCWYLYSLSVAPSPTQLSLSLSFSREMKAGKTEYVVPNKLSMLTFNVQALKLPALSKILIDLEVLFYNKMIDK